jgi:hypothetical protein
MSDISNFNLAVIAITVIGCWLAGFHHGKWAGIQKAEKHYALQQKALRAAKKRQTQR